MYVCAVSNCVSMSWHAGAGVYCGLVLGGCQFVVFVFCSVLVSSRREGSVFVNSEYWLLKRVK